VFRFVPILVAITIALAIAVSPASPDSGKSPKQGTPAGKSKGIPPTVGNHLSAQILESGSYLASGDNGHVADWVGVDNGAMNHADLRWIQAGISIFPGLWGTLPYAYVEAKYGPNPSDYYFDYVYAPDGSSYGAWVGRTGTNTYNASIDGKAVTETFTSTMTESYFGTEMLTSLSEDPVTT
jgi:hypothetical protein